MHSIHVINATGAFQHILSFFKQFLTPKIFERLTVHHSCEELHKHIPKKYLPKDYGGDEPSMAEFKGNFILNNTFDYNFVVILLPTVYALATVEQPDVYKVFKQTFDYLIFLRRCRTLELTLKPSNFHFNGESFRAF